LLCGRRARRAAGGGQASAGSKAEGLPIGRGQDAEVQLVEVRTV
jgi:hypothetical protein